MCSFKNNGISWQIWAFISGKGSSKLFFLDGKTRINGEVYCKILHFASKELKRLNVEFLMEDGALAHK